MVALQTLRINGEVITTPFSFVATTHSLWWNGIKPVFGPTNWYGVLLDQLTAAKMSLTDSKTYGVPVVGWLQGEGG